MTTPAKKRLVLLDAHAIIHRAYHALPDFSTRSGIPTGAIYGFGSMVLRIINDLKPDYIVACYDLPGKTFRHESFHEYKKGRAETDDTLKLQFNATRELCEALAIPTYDAPGFEADDILGTIIEQLRDNAHIEIIIASGDMDTIQLVESDRVRVFTLKRHINETFLYNEDEVVRRFGFKPHLMIDYKALRGDPADNIPGIKGVGEKTAGILIDAFGTIENMYGQLDLQGEQVLLDTGLTPRLAGLIAEAREEAEFSKVLATIRRDAPIQFSLPTESWKSEINLEKAAEIFQQYELRTLFKKLNDTLGVTELQYKVPPPLKKEKKEKDYEINFVPPELREIFIKLWLIDSDMANAKIEDIFEYTKTLTLEDAHKKINDILAQDKNLQRVFDTIEYPLIPIVERMQNNGVLLDVNFLKELSVTYHAELNILEKEIHRLAGIEFNIKSPKQLSEVLFVNLELPTKGVKKSKSGSYSTNIDTLLKLKDEYPIIQKIIEFRELEKLVSTYIDTLPLMLGDDKRIHAEFLQYGTVTGRFSSRNPNVQNIPTRTELGRKIREGFVAEKGYQLLSLDYSQIELRCLALLSGDERLIKIFHDNSDIHAAVAALIGKVPIDQVDTEMRRKAKVVNFGILYGMGIASLRKEMNTTREEAQIFYDGFFTQFPQATQFLENTKEHARTHGYTETLFGRKRQFKSIHSKVPFIRAMAERMALNAPIQGTSADIIKLAMIQLHHWIEREASHDDIRLVLQVHDELIYEVKDSLVRHYSEQAERIMREVLQNSEIRLDHTVPLVVHSSIGTHWGELK